MAAIRISPIFPVRKYPFPEYGINVDVGVICSIFRSRQNIFTGTIFSCHAVTEMDWNTKELILLLRDALFNETGNRVVIHSLYTLRKKS